MTYAEWLYESIMGFFLVYTLVAMSLVPMDTAADKILKFIIACVALLIILFMVVPFTDDEVQITCTPTASGQYTCEEEVYKQQ